MQQSEDTHAAYVNPTWNGLNHPRGEQKMRLPWPDWHLREHFDAIFNVEAFATAAAALNFFCGASLKGDEHLVASTTEPSARIQTAVPRSIPLR